jgi:putative transcriptional regulator
MICRLASLIDERNFQSSEKGVKERRLTQRSLAQAVGVASTTINRLYNNDFTRVDTTTIEKLCEFFGCSLEGKDGLFVLRDETSV